VGFKENSEFFGKRKKTKKKNFNPNPNNNTLAFCIRKENPELLRWEGYIKCAWKVGYGAPLGRLPDRRFSQNQEISRRESFRQKLQLSDAYFNRSRNNKLPHSLSE
jgi:hypothetical protein